VTQAPPAASWSLPATILWGIGLAFMFVLVQSIAMAVFALWGHADSSQADTAALLEAAQLNGTIFAGATLASALLCVPLIVGVVKLKPGADVADYLALHPVPLRWLGAWIAALAAYIALSDFVTYLSGRPVVPEFMTTIYDSAQPAWLLWLALVFGAPAFEELFFRGFLYRGFASSFMGPWGAIVLTAALWAAVHSQYDLWGIGTIFLMGLLLGFARATSRSVLVPVAMHAFANVVATIEAIFLR
jgi:membrane protease YdiL (CAAX protease family)